MSNSEIFQEFVDDLDKEIAWRKKELKNLKLHIEEIFQENRNNTEEKEFLLKGSIALIYAHWEGGVKNLFTYYIKFINKLLKRKNITIDSIPPKLLETIFFHIIENKLGYNNSKKRQKVINFCKDFFTNGLVKADLEIVNTKSNLNYKVYEELLRKLGICYENNKDKIEIEKRNIDILVNRRNHIAHGERISNLSKDLVIESLIKVIKLLELNKNMVMYNGEKLIHEDNRAL